MVDGDDDDDSQVDYGRDNNKTKQSEGKWTQCPCLSYLEKGKNILVFSVILWMMIC